MPRPSLSRFLGKYDQRSAVKPPRSNEGSNSPKSAQTDPSAASTPDSESSQRDRASLSPLIGNDAQLQQTPPATASSSSQGPLTSKNTARTSVPPVEDAPEAGIRDFLWTRAFQLFQERDEDKGLMNVYLQHIASFEGHSKKGPDLSDREFVEDVLSRLLATREERIWKITIQSHDIKIRAQFEKILKFLKWSDSLVKGALSSQPYAALAWSGVSLIIPLLTSGIEQNENMLEGLNTIGEIQIYWQVFEENFESEHKQHYKVLIEPLSKLFSDIIEYHARVIHHLTSTQSSRARQDLRDSNAWTAITERIKTADESCRTRFIPLAQQAEVRRSRDLQLHELQSSRAIQEKSLEYSQQIELESQKTRLLGALAGAAGDYQRYKDINPKRVPGTCEWFLRDNRFSTWRDGNSGLLWVSAGPGRGKSVLSRALVDEEHLHPLTTLTITSSGNLSGPTSIVTYFFFKEGIDYNMDGASALSAMLHQLFKSSFAPNFLKHALSPFKTEGQSLVTKFSLLWKILVDCATLSDANEIICVLDALDECNERSRLEIIKTIKEFYCGSQASSKAKLKFLITSRPYDDIEYSFKGFRKFVAYLRLDGDEKSKEIGREIDLVIDARVNSVTDGFSDKDRQRITDRLKSMENRTYLWLYLIFDVIEKYPAGYSRPSDMEELLSNLPTKVSDAYETILTRSKDPRRTIIILQLVLAARRPLTLEEANVALNIALHKEELTSHGALNAKMWRADDFKAVVMSACGLFVTVHDSKLSLIHQTARNFLISPRCDGEKGRWKGSLSLPQGHGMISQICLQYLLFPDIDKATDVEAPRDETYPLLPYASTYWPSHFADQEVSLADQSVKQARMLCDVNGHAANIWTPNYDFWRLLYLHNWTDLALSVFIGLEKVTDLLLNEGADPNAECGDYHTALQVAAAEGHSNIVRLLLSKGAKVNIEGGDYHTALHAASREGHRQVVKMLLDKGANVNITCDREPKTALRAASEHGHLEIVEMLVKGGANVNVLGGKQFCSALQAASCNGHIQIVRLLLENNAQVNVEGGEDHTALKGAIAQGHEDIVSLLLERGAEINIENGLHSSILQVASKGGHEGIVKKLLQSGADVNIESGIHCTALQAASAEGHTKIVEILINEGAYVNTEGGMYHTALQAASSRGREETVVALINKGADINVTGGAHFYTALQAASAHCNEKIVGILLKNGANAKIEGGKAHTALQAASSSTSRCETSLVKMLLDHGANVNAQGGTYHTALQAASYTGHEEVVNLLLRCGGRVNITGGKYHTALQAAACNGSEKIVKLLLESGAHVNVRGGFYFTALQAAVAKGHESIVNILIENGADVDCEGGKTFYTALQAASAGGHLQIVKILLNNGANIHIQGGPNYLTPLQAASYYGRQEIVRILLDMGANVNDAPGAFCGTALAGALRSGDPRIVKMLLDKNAIIDQQALDQASAKGLVHITEMLYQAMRSRDK
ncbi:hypothetical protein N7462_008495 [Penicillium macrosclerotiorum]|uniref:uncharacterized protein n=1 Tax=Penicillium macrosclerotiorum TaxID=303699 RepID=UPI0025491FEC|nr:uncharacterized protein N7462_008495 [Penicillium macrosclerotiorum]KAJ5675598.1 hypothetical protein N7462_008495 [Penicillium macrosclerotiorum]